MSLGSLSRWFCLFLIFTSGASIAVAQSAAPACPRCEEWNRPQAPFRIFGNTFYVGPRGLSSILITSDAGLVLIDGALAASAPLIAGNVRTLGFRMEDVKLILNSHVHYDHAGGIAELQRMSGARVVASKWSSQVLKKGGVGRDDPQNGILSGIAPVRRVRKLRDGETFRIGQLAITAHLTPGHTPGGTSWTWKSCENNVCRDMVYADSLSAVSAARFKFGKSRVYPRAVEDFRKSFAFLESTPCDILLTPHPEAAGLWDRTEARLQGAMPDPMIDSSACWHLAEDSREQLRERLVQERKP